MTMSAAGSDAGNARNSLAPGIIGGSPRRWMPAELTIATRRLESLPPATKGALGYTGQSSSRNRCAIAGVRSSSRAINYPRVSCARTIQRRSIAREHHIDGDKSYRA